jgi:Cu-processing system permease protein
LLLLSVSILGGTYFSTLANGVMVFGLYGVAFIGGWIEQIGSFMPDQTAQAAMNIGIITSLLLPSEALWKRAAYEIQSPLVASLGVSPLSSSTYPSNLMIMYAVGYMLIALILALRHFKHRDL